jgi:peptidoglycan/LPS O-acetylase OafA/YrhL
MGLAFEAILNAFPSVDSFFVMGGTLTAYIIFKELERAEGNILRHAVTIVLYYVHRYLRLTIPYALIMGVIIAVLPFVAYGPSWFYIEYGAQVAEEGGATAVSRSAGRMDWRTCCTSTGWLSPSLTVWG